jgi:hypothetical protein
VTTIDEPSIAVEDLLDYFVVAALGVSLKAKVQQTSELLVRYRGLVGDSQGRPEAWGAWRTNRGTVIAYAAYDREHSQRMEAHVLWMSWWIEPGEHHEGWWHCYPKRPREWIKGAGTKHYGKAAVTRSPIGRSA